MRRGNLNQVHIPRSYLNRLISVEFFLENINAGLSFISPKNNNESQY